MRRENPALAFSTTRSDSTHPPTASQTMATKGVHMRVAHGEGRCSVSYSPDGKQLITSGADTLVKVFASDDFNAEPRNIEHHEEAVTTLAINAKGKFFATGTKDHMVSYFSYPAAEFQKLLVRLTVPIRQVSFDKTGRFLAVASDDAVIRMVNVGVAQYTSLRGHTDSILCVVFDPQGDFLASSSADGTVRIWDIRDEPECIKTLQVTGKVPQGDEGHPRAAQLLRIAWHPTGQSLAVPYPEGVHVLERGTWEAQTRLQGSHTKEVTMASWSPNGRYLCSAGLDKQLFLWDLSSAAQRRVSRRPLWAACAGGLCVGGLPGEGARCGRPVWAACVSALSRGPSGRPV